MKKIIFVLVCLLFCSSTIIAEEIPAEQDCSVYNLSASAQNNLLQYDLSRNGTVVPPHVDSAWIVGQDNQTLPLLITNAQSGDYINISKLDRGYYLLGVKVGECQYNKPFFQRQLATERERDIITFSPEVIRPHQVRFVIRENNHPEPPYVDSLWVVGLRYGQSPTMRVYIRARAQSGDLVDIKPLLVQSETVYQLVVWIDGTDYWSDSFAYCGECEENQDIDVSFSNVNPHHAVMHITNGEEPVPHVDSLWITNHYYYNETTTLITGKYQAEETIDLASLVGREPGEYTAWLRFGDCIRMASFEFNGLEYDYCLDAGVRWVHIEKNNTETAIQYFLRDYDYMDVGSIPVDSVWITSYDINGEKPSEFMFSSKARPGEDINVSLLLYGSYNLHAQVGECEVSQLFNIFRHTQDVTEVRDSESTPVRKVIHEGLIYILRNGKTYTLQGQEVR